MPGVDGQLGGLPSLVSVTPLFQEPADCLQDFGSRAVGCGDDGGLMPRPEAGQVFVIPEQHGHAFESGLGAAVGA